MPSLQCQLLVQANNHLDRKVLRDKDKTGLQIDRDPELNRFRKLVDRTLPNHHHKPRRPEQMLAHKVKVSHQLRQCLNRIRNHGVPIVLDHNSIRR